MIVWVIYGYDRNWKEPEVYEAYLSEEKARARAKVLENDPLFEWMSISPVEVEE